MNKNHIRSQILKQRKSLSQEKVSALSKKIVKHITCSDLYQQAHHVALYLPINNEVDLTGLLQNKEKQHYVPSVTDEWMQFHPLTAELVLEKHRYGIVQPKYIDSLKPVPLDLCLLPLVGFDMNGNRLGMGGGFYDRYFEHNTTNPTALAGIGYQFQQQHELPVHSWDVKINHLFTEQGYFKL